MEKLVIDPSKNHYPDLDRIGQLKPNPHILLGKEIVWTEKRDGCLHGNVELFTDRGSMRIRDIVKEFENGNAPEILTVGIDGKTEFNSVINAMKRPHTHPFVQVYVKYIHGSKPTGSIRMNDGYETHRKSPLIVTDNHLFAVAWGDDYSGYPIMYKPAGSLQPGDMCYILSDKIPFVQEQVILGTLLGDGSVYMSEAGNCGFTFCHGMDQWDYLKYKADLLGDLCSIDYTVHPGGYDGSKGSRRCVSPINTHIHELISTCCYFGRKPSGRKEITTRFCERLSPISLAIWYCDDGSLRESDSQRPSAEISTHCYSSAEIGTLRVVLGQKFGISFERQTSGAIRLSSDSSETFFTLIAPYVPKSMQYKLPDKYRSGHCYLEEHVYTHGRHKMCYKVEVVRVGKPSDRHNITDKTMEYDIETENHNYFANGILVHNSNFGVYLDAEGNWHARSRNMDVASEQFHNYFKMTPQFDAVIELLKDAETWNDAYMVYGELLTKGKSPTKIEYHDDHSFVVFDIWSEKLGGFLHYTRVFQECHHHGLPIVELWGTCRLRSLESLLGFRDKLLEKSKECGREGTVGKYVNGDEYIYFKEKNDTQKYEKVPRAEDPDNMKIVLPPLPQSEVSGAIEKVYADLGADFFDVRVAMKKVAEYVSAECKKHNCSKPESPIFESYKDRVEELRRAGI